MFSTIHRYLRSDHAGEFEDIAQDIFLKVFRHLHKFDPERGVKLTTWVYALARNHCFDISKRRKIGMASLDECLEPEASLRQQPSAMALNSELRQRIEEAIQSLRPSYRRVFMLREFEQLDYAVIAEMTGVAEGTVKSRLHRAKQSLRVKLAPYVAQPQSSTSSARRAPPSDHEI